MYQYDREMIEEWKKKEKRSFLSYFLEFTIYFTLLFLLLVVSPKYVYGKSLVKGDSMQTTLKSKDILIQDKISYRFVNPKRYDIVIFLPWEEDLSSNVPEKKKDHWVKRIIGLPGEKIQIIDGKIYIDGEILEDDEYGTGEITYYGVAENPFLIPEGEYFVMGDNREGYSSWDSRYEEVGTIKKEQIEGRVIFRLAPLDSIGIVN